MIETYLAVEADGHLLRLAAEHNGADRYACGENRYELIGPDDWRYDDAPVFRLEDDKAVLRFLRRGSERWYSSEDAPSWGRWEGRPEALRFVRMTIQTIRTPLALDLPQVVEIDSLLPRYSTHDVRPETRERYGLPPEVDVWIVAEPMRKDGSPVSESEVLTWFAGKEIRRNHEICTLHAVHRHSSEETKGEPTFGLFLRTVASLFD